MRSNPSRKLSEFVIYFSGVAIPPTYQSAGQQGQPTVFRAEHVSLLTFELGIEHVVSTHVQALRSDRVDREPPKTHVHVVVPIPWDSNPQCRAIGGDPPYGEPCEYRHDQSHDQPHSHAYPQREQRPDVVVPDCSNVMAELRQGFPHVVDFPLYLTDFVADRVTDQLVMPGAVVVTRVTAAVPSGDEFRCSE